MNNYKKGKNSEEPLSIENIPIPNLPVDCLWMQVRGGSKIRNLLNAALKEFPEKKSVVWTGVGTSVGKAITCAEIMKRELNNTLHQITKICFRLIEEFWDPMIPELDQLVVKRQIPTIHILLSMEPLNCKEPGYQNPDVSLQYVPQKRKQNRNSTGHSKTHVKGGKKFKRKGDDMDKNNKSTIENR